MAELLRSFAGLLSDFTPTRAHLKRLRSNINKAVMLEEVIALNEQACFTG